MRNYIHSYLFEGKTLPLRAKLYFLFKKNEKATLIKKVALMEMISRTRNLSDHIHTLGGTYVLSVDVDAISETYSLVLRKKYNDKNKLDVVNVVMEEPIHKVAEVAKKYLATMHALKTYEAQKNGAMVGKVTSY